MNNNIQKIEEGFEVDHTDAEQLRYADEQSVPVPDAVVNTIVAEECVKEDASEARKWAKEQLDSITLNHMEMTSDDVMEKVPADVAIRYEEALPVYTSLEQILADIWKLETRDITVQELAMKVQRLINSGAYIQVNGTI